MILLKIDKFKNETILAFLLIVPILTISSKLYLGSPFLFYLLTLIALFIFVINNGVNTLNYSALCFSLLIMSILTSNVIFFSYKEDSIELLVQFLLLGALYFYLGFFVKDFEQFLRSAVFFSIISCFTLIPVPFIEDYNYMVFGLNFQSCLVFIIMGVIFLDYSKKMKIFFIAVSLLATQYIFVFGNRSASLIVIITIILCLLFSPKLSFKFKFVSLILSLSLITIIIYLISINIDELIELSSHYDINSYSLVRFRSIINNGFFEASSGRDFLALESLSFIANNPIFPQSIAFFRNNTITDQPYPHNIFLELALNLGLPLFVLLIITVFLLILIKRSSSSSLDYAICMVLLINTTIVLCVSSTYLVSSILWMCCSFLIPRIKYNI